MQRKRAGATGGGLPPASDAASNLDSAYFSDRPWSERVEHWLAGRIHERSFLDANVAAIKRYMSEPATGVRMVVNIPADALMSFCNEGVYRNAYNLPVVAGAAPEGPSKRRREADRLVGLDPPKEFFFGAVSIGGAGVRFYGEYCMVLRPDAVPADTRVFDRNSYDLLQPPLSAELRTRGDAFAGVMGGTWAADTVDMLLLKVLPEIRSTVRLLTVGTAADAVLHDEDFLEVHRKGSFRPEHLEEVRLTPEDQAIEERIVQRLRSGVVPACEELLWMGRRTVAEEVLYRRGIRTRVVASSGRGSRWD